LLNYFIGRFFLGLLCVEVWVPIRTQTSTHSKPRKKRPMW